MKNAIPKILSIAALLGAIVAAGAGTACTYHLGAGLPLPSPTPTSSSTPSSSTFTVSSSSQSVALPAVGGFSGTIDMPGAQAGAGVLVTMRTQVLPPSGTPSFPSGSTPDLYIGLQFASAVTWPHTPGFTVSYPSTPTGTAYAAIFDTNTAGAWETRFVGPGALVGSTETLTGTTPGPNGQGTGGVYPLTVWYSIYTTP